MKHVRRKAQNAKPIKIRGNLILLREVVSVAGVQGRWEQNPEGMWRYIAENRAAMNWASRRGTVWFDGPTKARVQLQANILRALKGGAAGLYRSP
jgi:hypothetical protein